MSNLFGFKSKKRSLREREERTEAYRKIFLNDVEEFKFHITQPLLQLSEYQNAVQRYLSPWLATLEEELDHHSLVRRFKDQYAEEIIGLTERLTILSEIAEKQQIGSEVALLGYQKTLQDELLGIKRMAEEFFQQVNKDMTELLHLVSTVLFKQSGSLFDTAKWIRTVAYLDLFNIQNDNLALPDYLLDALPELVATEAFPQAIRQQSAEVLEKLSLPKNAKLMVFSLNAAFNTLPHRLKEIRCNKKASITARIQDLGRFFDEKTVEPLEHYLVTAQDYFNLLLRLDRDDPGLIPYVEAHSSEEQLFEGLLEKFKKSELAALILLKQAFRAVFDREVNYLKEINHELGGASEPLINLIDEYNGRLHALELMFAANLKDYDQLSSFSELSNYYSTILEMIKLHSIEIRKKTAEYRLIGRIFKKARCFDKEEVDFFWKEINDPDYRENLVKCLTEKAFYLLGKVPSSKFAVYIENLLQFAAADEAALPPSDQPDALFLFKKALKASLRGKQLACFVQQQPEKICEYLDSKHSGPDCGPFSVLNGYLNYCELSRLEALAKNKPNLQDTIKRMILTKELLDLQSKCHAGSLWEICEWFYRVDRYECPLPFFTTPQDKIWFFSTMDSFSFLRNAIERINAKKNTGRASFFFLNSEVVAKKQEALDQLKEQLKTLPNLMDNQVLDEEIKSWETKFGAVIDKQGYRFYLIVGVMIYQVLMYYILGQTTKTESRHCVELLKKHLYRASEAIQANFQEEMPNRSPLVAGLTP